MNQCENIVVKKKGLIPSNSLLEAVATYSEVVVLMHDNPDPDAIAAGWAIKQLIDERQFKHVRLVGGGAIMRAENRHMVELLKPPVEIVDEIVVRTPTAVIVVDGGEEADNRIDFSGRDAELVAVIDHHEYGESSKHCSATLHRDVRPEVAASATIAAEYLREQDLTPNVMLASALVYAIRAETRGFQTHFSEADRLILPWLTQFFDPQIVAEIEDAPLPRTYYGELLLALQNVYTYGGAAFCLLPKARGAELVGEIADLLIRCEGVHQALCGASIGNDILISVRTDHIGGNAADLIRQALQGLGRSGGHTNRSGGKITGRSKDGQFDYQFAEDLRKRWIEACGVNHQRGTPLIPRREFVDNL